MQNPRPLLEYQGLNAAVVRIARRLKTIIILGLIAEVVLNCINIITAYDFPWQLAEGYSILTNGHVPHNVLQAYGEASPHFANEYILYEILIAGLSQSTGSLGLCLFFGLLAFLIYTPCLLAFFRLRGRTPLITIFLFLFAQYIINNRLAARPELIADFCFLSAGMMLLKYSNPRWSILQTLGFGLIYSIWANVHGTFLLGLFMLGLWYGQFFLGHWRSLFFTRDFSWIRPGLAALLGCSLNPFGMDRFAQPFQLHTLLWGQATSAEMWPVTADIAWPTLLCTLLALFALFTRVRTPRAYWLAPLPLLFQWLTFSSNRYGIFIALTLLLVIWEELRWTPQISQAKPAPLFINCRRLAFCFLTTICFGFFIGCLFYAKAESIKIHYRAFYRDTLVATSASLTWLRAHPAENYLLLSALDAGSSSQMPGYSGVHPLLDSGTHRYSDRVNKLFYYTLYSPDTLRLVISKLETNAVILGKDNIYWAPVLNASPDWDLVQIDPDTQLYLRRTHSDKSTKQILLSRLELPPVQPDKLSVSRSYLFRDVARGLNLRPDKDSLNMLTSSADVLWMFDPHITYLQDWLAQVPDTLVKDAFMNLGGKMDDSSAGLRIMLSLRLKQYKDAAGIADQWHPFILNVGYQNMQELRAEAYLSAGNRGSAKKILGSLWPKPRYSLRWARLCQQAYRDDLGDMPETARQLISLDGNLAWQEELISSLNQNILRLSTQAP